MRFGEIDELAAKCNTEVIPADATSTKDLENLIQAAIDKYGKIDFILHSIGMSPNVRKKLTYDKLNYDYYQKHLISRHCHFIK